MSFQFPQPLLNQINRVGLEAVTEKSTDKAKKLEILAVALANLSHGTSTTEVHLLDNQPDYVQTKGNPPSYFKNYFFNVDVNVTAVSDSRYDYATSRGAFQTWVDFANPELGGGAFGRGMYQEETMTLEMPELANAAAIGFRTRDGKEKESGSLQSNPTPLLIARVHRTIALDPKLYGDGWLQIPVKDFCSYITPLAPDQVQEVNILAVAAPKLDSTAHQTDPATIYDLFNTFVAAYSEARRHTPQGEPTIINTGPIGTGDYKNSKAAVYVLQRLAAQQVKVDLRYWALRTTDQRNYDDVVHKIISEYNTDKQKPGDDTLSHLLALAQRNLQNL